MAAFRAALVVDIRQHRLAWSVILAGLLASAMIWGSIAGLPLAHRAPFEAAAPTVVGDIEHPVEIEPAE